VKKLVLIFALILSNRAMAVGECAGRTSDGSFVVVDVTTSGATGIPAQGSVTIQNGGNKFGYRFQHDEIAQYFEYDDVAAKSAVVGLSTYVTKEYPLFVKYVGPNFVDMDLQAVVDGGKTADLVGNVLRVWKGPGHAATDQYQISRPACSVWSNL
jgi:hypothetical protein